MRRLVRNQCMKVPSAGIMLGYFFVLCSVFCSPVSCGPYWRGICCFSLLPWEGGLNLAGFSRTRGFEVLAEAYRQVGKVRWDICGRFTSLGNRLDESRCPRGRRKRGIVALISATEQSSWSLALKDVDVALGGNRAKPYLIAIQSKVLESIIYIAQTIGLNHTTATLEDIRTSRGSNFPARSLYFLLIWWNTN